MTLPTGPRGVGRRAAAAIVALFLLGVVAGDAHDTWLLPDTLRVPVGRAVAISLTSGTAFPADDFAIDPARVARASVRLGGATATLGSPATRPLALQYPWVPRRAGVATLAVALLPKDLELTSAQVREYLDDINASRGLRAAWLHRPEPRRWRERYTKHAKSFVVVEGPPGPVRLLDSSWAVPVNLALEIVPERDPTALRAGDALPLRVLFRGAPLPRFMVGAQRAGEPGSRFVETDAAGRASVPLPRPGLWLLNGTLLRPAADPAREWDSDFTTLTIAVRPGPAPRVR